MRTRAAAASCMGWWVGFALQLNWNSQRCKGAGRGDGCCSTGGGCEHGEAGTVLHGEPHPPWCSHFSGFLVSPKAAPVLSPSPHLSSDPVKSTLPGLLLHQLLEQRLVLNNSSGFQKVSLPFGLVLPALCSLPRCHRGTNVPDRAQLLAGRGPGWRNICRNPFLAVRFCNCAGY